MEEFKRTFYKSKMNQDIDSRLLEEGEYVSATNWESSGSGVLENSLSNKKLTNLSLGSNVTTLGMFFDEAGNNIYWFVKSDSGDYVIEHSQDSLLTTIVLEDTSAGILNFSTGNLITGVNLIVDSDRDRRFLCWTDNRNNPRCINIDRAKTYGANNFTEEDIALIKKPPTYAPDLTFNTTVNFENFIEDKFLSYAYRYKYLDGEWSALSSFTNYAFRPNKFDLDYEIMENEGMINNFNEVIIAFNTGSERVSEIEIVFKESNSTNINVIEKFKKSEEGWGDNETKTLNFSNNKVYRILPEDELFRQYDNVPRKAKSQEVIGNRLVFGNYLEGYNIEDEDGEEIKMDYSLSLVSNDLSYADLTYVGFDDDTTMIIDLTGITLSEGLTLNINVVMDSVEAGATATFTHNFSYVLTRDYVDTDDLFSDTGYIYFVESVMSAVFEAEVVISATPPDTVDTIYNPFVAVSTTTGFLSIQGPTLQFEIDPTPGAPTSGDESTEIYRMAYSASSAVSYRLFSNDNSLKTNRSYEIGIIYLDEYGRASTVLTNPLNTIYIDQSLSTLQNKIVVNVNHIPPYWADRYKFVIKENTSGYETIYVNNFVEDGLYRWVKLEGTNRQKVKEGDVLIVKSDLEGPKPLIIKVKVLEVTSKPENFIPDNYRDPIARTIELIEEDGVYMKIKPVGFSIDTELIRYQSFNAQHYSPSAIGQGEVRLGDHTQFSSLLGVEPTSLGGYYDFDISKAVDLPINVGTRINLEFVVTTRPQNGIGDVYRFERNVTSQGLYNNFQEWWTAEMETIIAADDFANHATWSFVREADPHATDATKSNQLYLKMTSDEELSPKMFGNIEIYFSQGDLIFETEPEYTNNIVFFETGQTFDIVAGEHQGNTQNQISSTDPPTPAICELDAFNCYVMGNGAESYKYKDVQGTKSLALDQRPAATSPEKYGEKRRIADLTYGEVYEQTTNVNGLNEFNLSKINWKTLDDKFGTIQKLHSTDTDLLVFQEDKVHRVLYQKDVLFDADASGNIRESNKVLGQEVPYAGEFGISTQPESFASFGNYKYFTDVRRGSVMRLDKSGLTDISQNGMSDFFRDAFKVDKNGKKIGAYDPYNDNYVLFNDATITSESVGVPAGSTVSSYELESATAFVLSPTESLNDITLNYSVTGTVNISVDENGTDTDLGNVTGTGSLVYSRVFPLQKLALTFTVTPISVTPTFDLEVVKPVDEVPTVSAVADSIDVFKGGSDDFNVLVNDTFSGIDTLTVTIDTPPYKGAATVNPDKTINYVHANADLLPDEIIYQIDDGLTTDTGTVSITVNTDISGGATGVPFDISTYGVPSGTSEGENVCSATIDAVKWHDGSNFYPVLDDIVYDDVNKTTAFKGQDKFYRIQGGKTIRISNAGKVTLVWICGISI